MSRVQNGSKARASGHTTSEGAAGMEATGTGGPAAWIAVSVSGTLGYFLTSPCLSFPSCECG